MSMHASTSGRDLSFGGSLSQGSALQARPCPRPSAPARAPLVVEDRAVIRFQRFGRTKLPFYRLVAIDSRRPRDSMPIEYLGWYDPLKKETSLKAPEIKRWLGVGALPSLTVENLLRKALIIDSDRPRINKLPAMKQKKGQKKA